MENQVFDLDAFIAGINRDKSQPRSSKDRLNRVLMNTRDNQGTNSFIPIIGGNGNIYTKLTGVYEYFGDTTLIDNGEAWYRILPIEYYSGLSDEDMELYSEVKSLLEELDNSEELGYDELRVRNYALFNGINIMLKNTEGKVDETIKDCPCLFIYPSNAVINQLSAAINAKCDAMKGSNSWIQYVITPATKGREGIMQITYTKSSGVGYDATVNFEMNSAFNQVIDPEFEVSEKTMELFKDVLPTFLGWIYDNQNKSNFNRVAFKELRTQLRNRVNQINGVGSIPAPEDSTKVYENKNDMKQPEQSQMKKTPF